ncbi:MAG: hypothetical protein H0X30_14370 [Anaerolineae bacterium]|nr:hypothetical protein [Anaerolineae bacterium]
MSGVAAVEIKRTSNRKILWICLIITVLVGCILILPNVVLKIQVEQRVNNSLHMYPGAELIYDITSERSVYWKVKTEIFWIDVPFDQVKDYPLVTNYRQFSYPGSYPSINEQGMSKENFFYRLYHLSDAPQEKLDRILAFPSDVGFYNNGDGPFDVTSVSVYVIARNWISNGEPIAGTLNFQGFNQVEISGTYIIVVYRIP